MTVPINLDEKFCLFEEPWRPKVIAALNGQEIKVGSRRRQDLMRPRAPALWLGSDPDLRDGL
jgi:hypothetical protein